MEITKEVFAKSIRITKLSAASVGILLYNRRKPISKCKRILSDIYYNFLYYFLSIGVLGLIIDLFRAKNFIAATNGAPCTLYSLISLLKMKSVSRKLEKSEKLLNDLEDLWPVGVGLGKEMTKIVLEYTFKCNRIKYAFTVFNISFISAFDVSAAIFLIVHYLQTGEIVKFLPYLIYMPFDTSAKYVYPFVYLFHVLTSSIVVIGVILSDTFFITIITHTCTQFKLLQNRIEHLVEEFTPSDIRSSLDIDHNHHQRLYHELRECIKRHSELIELSNTVEDIFSVSLLMNFMSSSIIICCVGFQSTVATGVELVIFVLFLITSLYQIFVLCWAGHELKGNSNAIADAAYNSSWYLMDKKYRQLIHIIILRAQTPQVVTALRFSVVSFNSFASILSTSYSYFTLLNTSYKPDKK